MKEKSSGTESASKTAVRSSAKPKKKPARRKAAPRKQAVAVTPPIAGPLEQAIAKPVRNFRRTTREVISGRFAKIMVKMAEASEEGSLPHTKYLFDIGGVKEDIHRRGRGKAEPSLADLLLAEVRRQHAEEAASRDAAATKGDASSESADGLQERGPDCGAKEQ